MSSKTVTHVKANNSNSTAKSVNNLADKFEFYARIVKLVVLRNDDTDVVSKYSTWLDALRKHPDAELRYDYVRLLVMGLEHPVTVCPFNDYPPPVLEPLDGGWPAAVLGVFRRRPDEDAYCREPVLNPPVVTAVSDDRRRFAAFQAVPDAGLQVFYAQSDEPLYEWFFKFGSPSRPPAGNVVQATSLDWERSLAGIHRRASDSKNVFGKPSAGPSVKGVTFEDIADTCIILRTEQENIRQEIGKFKWNDKSLLDGDTIPGSDLCIDWMIHEHDKTQLEIDEEMVVSFDKLYPDNFRLLVSPELLEGIVKKMECAEENRCLMDSECEKIEEEASCQEPNRQCAGNDQYLERLKRFEKQLTGDDILPPEQNGQFSAGSPGSSAIDHIRLQDGDTVPYGKRDFEDHFSPSPFVGMIEDDENRCSDQIPSFKNAAKSFYSIAIKAEDTMKEVNDWLKSKKRKF